MKTEVAKFDVVSADGETSHPTEVHHMVDEYTGYELFTITQIDPDTDEYLTVVLHREQLASLANIAKGH